jgi:replicative DNA helicase
VDRTPNNGGEPEAVTIPNVPEATDIEALVLGAMLTDDDAIESVLGLTADDFYIIQHRQIWLAAKWLHEHGQEVDRITVGRRLTEAGHLESVGGYAYLAGLDHQTPKLYGLATYLGTLRTVSTLRRAAIGAHSLSERLCLPGAGLEAIREAEAFLRDLAANAEAKPQSLRTLSELIESVGLDNFVNGGGTGPGIPTPWAGLNSMLTGGGFRPGQLIVIGGRPGIGKSAASAAIALMAAPHRPAIFNLEMSDGEVWHRIIASDCGLPLRAISEGRLDRAQRAQVLESIERLGDSILIDDSTGAKISTCVSAIKRRKGPPIGMVVLDYLQLFSGEKKTENRATEVAMITRAAKIAAKQLKVPFVVLAQLNRRPAEDDKEPQLHHLRESGAVEQDADMVLFLHAKQREIEEAIALRKPCDIDLILAKQRNGALGRIKLRFFAGKMQMLEVDNGGI